jgi:hypothetical protein
MSTHPLRRSSRIALLVLGAAMLALVLNQCRMVGDQVTAPAGVGTLGQHPDNHGNCISQCAKAYADSNQVESKLHEANLGACGNDRACSDTENARYEAVKARITEGRKTCFDECHHQGGGSGGR